jgi:hypothetical protein
MVAEPEVRGYDYRFSYIKPPKGLRSTLQLLLSWSNTENLHYDGQRVCPRGTKYREGPFQSKNYIEVWAFQCKSMIHYALKCWRLLNKTKGKGRDNLGLTVLGKSSPGLSQTLTGAWDMYRCFVPNGTKTRLKSHQYSQINHISHWFVCKVTTIGCHSQPVCYEYVIYFHFENQTVHVINRR